MRYDKSTTQGRWPSILAALGVDEKTLSKRNVACPFCGGVDRFRFTDHEGAGVWVCNQCGEGNGIHFVMKWENVDFIGAVKKVNEVLPTAAYVPTQPSKDYSVKMRRLWSQAHPIEALDPVAEYLANRGLDIPDTTALRTLEECPYYEDGVVVAGYPAMLALVRDQHGKAKTLHVTYVKDGQKAPVRAPRKVLSKTGDGPSVRMYSPIEGRLHIAEGIETALAVRQTNRPDGVLSPVWSCLSAGAMQQFKPPAGVEHLWVWADNDDSFTGQHAAYSLAHRLTRDKACKVTVMMPSIRGTDWADVFTVRREP